MGWLDKIRNKKDTIKILLGVSRIALGGKSSKILDKVTEGTELADKALEIAELVKAMRKSK